MSEVVSLSKGQYAKEVINAYEYLEQRYVATTRQMKKDMSVLRRRVNELEQICLLQQDTTAKITEFVIIDRVYKPLALTGTVVSGVLAGIFGLLVSPVLAVPFVLSMSFSVYYLRFLGRKD